MAIESFTECDRVITRDEEAEEEVDRKRRAKKSETGFIIIEGLTSNLTRSRAVLGRIRTERTVREPLQNVLGKYYSAGVVPTTKNYSFSGSFAF